MNVISLDRARARLRALQRIEPPAALSSPVRARRPGPSPEHLIQSSGLEARGLTPSHAPPPADDGGEGEDRLRMRQNLAAFLVIVAIVTAGSWLMASLHHYSRLQTCLEAGHRNCLPLQAKYLAQPYWH